jgi:hypothetical protein
MIALFPGIFFRERIFDSATGNNADNFLIRLIKMAIFYSGRQRHTI